MRMCCDLDKGTSDGFIRQPSFSSTALTSSTAQAGRCDIHANIQRTESMSSTKTPLPFGDMPIVEPDAGVSSIWRVASASVVTEQYWDRLPPKETAVCCTDGVLALLTCGLSRSLSAMYRRHFMASRCRHDLPTSTANLAASSSSTNRQSTSKSQVRGGDERMVAVLECILAKGTDLDVMPPNAKVLRIPLAKQFDIGRACQYRFFEMLLKAESKWAAFVSRRHCRLTLSSVDGQSEESACAMTLSIENLGTNAIHIDGVPLIKGASIKASEGSVLSFLGGEGGHEIFLKFAFRRMSLPTTFDDYSTPFASGQQPEADVCQADSHVSAIDIAAAVLECVYTVGNDLAGLPPQAKALGLPLGVSVEMGRLCQPGFFETLLQGEPQWITQLSRKHCCLQLSQDGGNICLSVQNLGANAIFVDGERLANECWKTLSEGGILGFAAAVSGSGETRFFKLMEFMLKRRMSDEKTTEKRQALRLQKTISTSFQ